MFDCAFFVDTIKHMKITYDAAKYQTNIEKHGVSFDLVASFDMSTALIWQDMRKDYQESRYCALGLIDARVYLLVFTMREDTVRVISFRKANKREVKKYVEYS